MFTTSRDVEQTKPNKLKVTQMKKTISVYIVEANEAKVTYPSKATANKAKETLTAFGIDATVSVEKKTFDLTEATEA